MTDRVAEFTAMSRDAQMLAQASEGDIRKHWLMIAESYLELAEQWARTQTAASGPDAAPLEPA